LPRNGHQLRNYKNSKYNEYCLQPILPASTAAYNIDQFFSKALFSFDCNTLMNSWLHFFSICLAGSFSLLASQMFLAPQESALFFSLRILPQFKYYWSECWVPSPANLFLSYFKKGFI